MTFENIIASVEAGIATITINRESQMNALNIVTIQEIGSAMRDFYIDESVKAVIITGAGSKSFVAGADIKEFSNFSPEEAFDMSAAGHDVFNYIEDFPKPVVALIKGFTLGGGCELAMSCHLRVATPNAKFGQPEVNLGLIPGYGGTQRLIRLAGHAKALEMLLTADMISAEEAHRIGLVNHVVALEEIDGFVHGLLGKMISKSPLTITQIIRLCNQYHIPEYDSFQHEIQEFSNCFATEDFKEGVDAFMNKRKPDFKGE